MSDVAIHVENLGKKYKIGRHTAGDLRNAFGNFIRNIQGGKSHEVATATEPTYAPREHDFWALRDINLTVNKGEAVGIIGRNGAGKSTLLKILSRITEPTTGHFTVNGRLSSLLEVGTGFHMELTGRENIYLNGTILGMKRREIRNKFDEIVEFSGVEEFIDTPVKHYSSGMKVRLAFSVAAHLEPEILVIDEVLAVGDSEFQKKCMGKMEDVTQQGRTVLFVSHNMGAVQSLCNKGILLSNGKIDLSADITTVVSKYLKNEKTHTLDENIGERKGTGNVRITDLKFYDKSDHEINDVISGKLVKIRIRYKSNFQQLKNVIIGLVVTNAFGQFLTVLNNKMANYNFERIQGSGEIECTIKKFPLMAGLHFISVNLYVNGINEDYLEGVKRFTVENSDFYSSGFPNAYKRQGVYIEQEWRSF